MIWAQRILEVVIPVCYIVWNELSHDNHNARITKIEQDIAALVADVKGKP